jgi:hypothetical protein
MRFSSFHFPVNHWLITATLVGTNGGWIVKVSQGRLSEGLSVKICHHFKTHGCGHVGCFAGTPAPGWKKYSALTLILWCTGM